MKIWQFEIQNYFDFSNFTVEIFILTPTTYHRFSFILIACIQFPGESYAGKYLPTLAYTIFTKNSSIHVYGVFMGNPAINMEDMLPHYSSYFTAHGLLDAQGSSAFKQREQLILSHIHAKKWPEAAELYQDTFYEAHTKKRTVFEELTGIRNHYNLVKDKIEFPSAVQRFLNASSTKKALHVKDINFEFSNMDVYRKMKSDIMKSMKPQIGIVMENFRVLIYSGQFDIICPYYLQMQVTKNVDWSGNWDYMHARRRPLLCKKWMCGYYKRAKLYTEVMIRNAGHFVPTDRPQWALALLRKFADGSFDAVSVEEMSL